MKVGLNETLTYKPSIRTNDTFGFVRESGLVLGVYKTRLEKFLSYDPLANEMTIEAAKTSREDIGTYDIIFYVTFSNPTFE